MELSKRFSFGVVLTLIARILMAGNSVVSGVIVARWLGADGLGAVTALSVAIGTTMLISSFGVPTANTYFVARQKRPAASAAANSVLFAIVSGSIFAVALWGLAVCRPGLLANLPGALVAIAVVALPFQLATALGINLFLAVGRVREFSALDLITQSFIIFNAVIALVLLKGDLWLLVSFNSIAAAISAFATFALLFRYLNRQSADVGGRWRIDFARLRETWRYGLRGQVLAVATVLVLRIDLLIVAYSKGATEAGLYAVATQVTLFLLLLPNAVSQLLLARSAASHEAAADFACRAARYTAFLMLLACLASVPVSFVLPVLYGPVFEGVPYLVWLLLPGVFFMSLQTVLVQYFVGTGLPRIVIVSWILTLILYGMLNLLIVPRWGGFGAAMVSTFSYTLIFCLIFMFFRLRTGHGIRDILVLKPGEFRELMRLRFGSVRVSEEIL